MADFTTLFDRLVHVRIIQEHDNVARGVISMESLWNTDFSAKRRNTTEVRLNDCSEWELQSGAVPTSEAEGQSQHDLAQLSRNTKTKIPTVRARTSRPSH